jgi:diguanylate cyclase (GGDEF)-like protein/PAS domain S-box-containing protein
MTRPQSLSQTNDQALRLRAEALAADQTPAPFEDVAGHSPFATSKLLHELQVHQIELEMQNAALRDAHAALERTQARYFDLYDLAPVGYLSLDLKGKVLEANLMAADLLGVTRNRLLGRPLQAFIEPEDQDNFYLLCNRLRHCGGALAGDLRVRHAKGNLLWVHAMLSLSIEQGNAGDSVLRMTLNDITDQHLAYERLRVTDAALKAISQGVLITGTDRRIVWSNASFEAISGYSEAEMLGRDCNFMQGPLSSPEVGMSINAALRQEREFAGEILNYRKDGSSFWNALTISPVRDEAGHLSHFVGITRDITAEKTYQAKLDHLAYFDVLTGLPNRLLKADRLNQAMIQARRTGHGLALVYIDLDGFKAINDAHGRATGDQMLVAVAKQMHATLREGDTLARIGGDEFVAVLLEVSELSACAPLLERLLTAAAQPFLVGDLMLHLSASLGVTFYPQDKPIEADQLLRQADHAMYQAKLTGKGSYCAFDTRLAAHLRSDHERLQRVQQAFNDQEFLLFYQPKVHMPSGELVGLEALIRWQHPSKGILAPAEFLPLIEEHPLAILVGEWVIDTVLSQIAAWKSAGLRLPVSVNLGAHQMQQVDFVSRFSALLLRHPDVDPTDFELEIVETSALQDTAFAAQVIDECRRLGVRFALDDFGTGYSSLTYLKRLKVDKLKIDQGFVRDMLKNPDDLLILKGIIGLASAFDYEVIAEGVETIAHGAMLMQIGCNLAQGNVVAMPMPAQEVLNWASHWPAKQLWGS